MDACRLTCRARWHQVITLCFSTAPLRFKWLFDWKEKQVKQSLMLMTFILAAALLSAYVPAFAAAPGDGLALVQELGRVNGQAMACADMSDARRAKSLMLAHAPKTQTHGDAFQAATHEAFLAQTKEGTACPEASALAARLDALEAKLKDVLPIAAVPAQ